MKISFKIIFFCLLIFSFVFCSKDTLSEETEEIIENTSQLAPAKNFDLTTWNISIPENNGSGVATTISVLSLNKDYQNENYFYTS